MIGQNIGLKYLIPLAVQVLKKDCLAEGHFYPGDLLKSILTSEKEYWNTDLFNKSEVINVYIENRESIEKCIKPDSIFGTSIREHFDKFCLD